MPFRLPMRAVLAACAVLAGCGDQTLILDRGIPDEYNVLVRPPLTMPPIHDALPPPQNHQEIVDTGAPRLFAPTDDPAPRPLTAGEQSVLNLLGAADGPSTIRQRLLEDQSRLTHTPRHIIDQLLNLTRKFAGLDDSRNAQVVVDGPKEAQRLRDNQAQNLPPTQGSIPSITISP